MITNGLENVVFILLLLLPSSQLHKRQCSGIDDIIRHKSYTCDYIWINRGCLLLMSTGQLIKLLLYYYNQILCWLKTNVKNPQNKVQLFKSSPNRIGLFA